MRRRLLNILTVFSAILCVATVVLWVRSYSRCDDVHYTFGPSRSGLFRAVDVGSIDGHAFLAFLTLKDRIAGRDTGLSISAASGHSRLWSWPLATMGQFYQDGQMWQKFGVVAANDITAAAGTESVHGIAVPHWALAMSLFIFWLIRSVGWWRYRRRNAKGCCTECGYDLRASAERCPECGTPIPATVSA